MLDRWEKRSNTPVTRVRYCGGIFVAVGPSGTILTSPDGTIWTPRIAGTTRDLRGVSFGPYFGIGNAFVIVGDETLLVSSNAVTWSAIPIDPGSLLSDVASSGTRFVAVGWPQWGEGPSAWFYPKLVGLEAEWGKVVIPTQQPIPLAYALLSGIAFGGGRFAAVSMGTGLWTTADGSTWTFRTNEFAQNVAFGNQRFVAVGTEGPPLCSTNNGTTWFRSLIDTNNPSNQTNYISATDITFGNGMFVAIGGVAGLLATTNGVNWSVLESPPGGISIAYGAGTFVTAAAYGSPGIWQSGNIAGALMVRLASPMQPVEVTVANDPGRIFAVQASSNLFQWSELWRSTNTGAGSTQFVDWSVTNTAARFYRAVTP
jgi:hypothetical protein